ncbi:inositol monophosphatase [Prochlorococcus sp. AH-716-K03]|nr:inositol monophosphatase [Prochlorococcus sp. AH-716-K03]
MLNIQEINEINSEIDLNLLTKVAKESALIGNEILIKNYNKIQTITLKGRKGDLVTNVDLEVEEKIKEYLTTKTPAISIHAEESGKLIKTSELTWCIDPLDGTTNYSHGYPFFGTSIGLLYKNNPILGAVSIPYLNELYSACIGKGSYCNNKKLKVSDTNTLIDSLLVTGFSYDRFETEDNNYAEFCYLTHKTRGVRRGGAAAVDLAFVASGKVDAYWESGLEIWDLAAGAIIVKEAGGAVSNYPNGEFDLSSGRILACNPRLEEELKLELSKVTPFNKQLYI